MKFYLENGNVSGKVRNALKADALNALAEDLKDAGYELEGKSLFKVIGNDEDTGNVIRVRIDVVVTDR